MPNPAFNYKDHKTDLPSTPATMHMICWDWNDNESAELESCSAEEKAAAFCSPGDACTSNGLCIGPAGDLPPFSMKGCTVAEWTTTDVPGCPNNCFSSKPKVPMLESILIRRFGSQYAHQLGQMALSLVAAIHIAAMGPAPATVPTPRRYSLSARVQ